eukprot:TRINITY_DN5167_c0_g1_i1.p1 TRINITY_DN5167_c0_g1~~TRINITY_DN5167_c0_g1_i1.p1  ORF type:complete len:659 (+),score=161.96 TRINITY_DN5167_c0_g1_i1:91-1977(+)
MRGAAAAVVLALPYPAWADCGGPGQPPVNIAGEWLGGNGDKSLPIEVTQEKGCANFTAVCNWTAGPGRPTPWVRRGVTDANGSVTLFADGHAPEVGFVAPTSASGGGGKGALCWTPDSWWCIAKLHNCRTQCAFPGPPPLVPPEHMHSVVGDPGMSAANPRWLLEGWNFCNRCGRACKTAPRWADCISADGRQLVTPADNAAGLGEVSQTECDAFSEQKERDLSRICAQKDGSGGESYFWTAMLKSGAMNVSERGRLCGLWCDELGCNPPHNQSDPPTFPDADGVMRQPFVAHMWSAQDAGGGWAGSLYGTYDYDYIIGNNTSPLATPAEVIADVDPVSWYGCHNKSAPCPSFFGLEWFVRDGRRITRGSVRSGKDLVWIMLYLGAEAAHGPKGGYPWDGRGIMTTVPQTHWPTDNSSEANDFIVRMWSNITIWSHGPGFYFLNFGACWKDDGRECDGNATTDVTRYLLFELPGAHDTRPRCGPGRLDLCPEWHHFANGESAHRSEVARFPYSAYHSVTRTRRHSVNGLQGCKNDCWSNPQDQDWVRISPGPEWSQYGFPNSTFDAQQPQKWDMHAGAVCSRIQFSGKNPPYRTWHTLNQGPEQQAGPGGATVWEIAEYDVLVPNPQR